MKYTTEIATFIVNGREYYTNIKSEIRQLLKEGHKLVFPKNYNQFGR